METIQTEQKPNIVLVGGGMNIEVVNASLKEIEKLRDIFVELIQAQVHRIKGGKMILHFDEMGNMRHIEIQKVVWKKEKVITS